MNNALIIIHFIDSITFSLNGLMRKVEETLLLHLISSAVASVITIILLASWNCIIGSITLLYSQF